MMVWLVHRRGLLDPATVGAASAVMPDLEHLIPRSLRRKRKLFHPRRRQGDPDTDEVSVGAQLLLTALLILPVLAGRKRQTVRRSPTSFPATSIDA